LGEESVAVAEEVRIAGTQEFAVMGTIVTYAAIASTGEKVQAVSCKFGHLLLPCPHRRVRYLGATDDFGCYANGVRPGFDPVPF
jgi:hypothetical protein